MELRSLSPVLDGPVEGEARATPAHNPRRISLSGIVVTRIQELLSGWLSRYSVAGSGVPIGVTAGHEAGRRVWAEPASLFSEADGGLAAGLGDSGY
jgi:hypothetical protein